MFYAVLALALHENFQTSKHGQLQGWFNKNFIKTGVFEPSFFRMLQDAFERRTDADYEIKPMPDADSITRMLADMRLFISTIKAWLDANPAT